MFWGGDAKVQCFAYNDIDERKTFEGGSAMDHHPAHQTFPLGNSKGGRCQHQYVEVQRGKADAKRRAGVTPTLFGPNQ